MNTESISLWIAGAIVVVAIGAFAMLWGKVTTFTEKYAAPLRAKPENERTLTDKLIIEADRRADLLNIQQYEIFLQNFVAMYINDILAKAPVVGPLVVAGEYVDRMMDSLQKRNPELAARLKQTRNIAEEKLAGTIGKTLQDALSSELNKIGLPNVQFPPSH